MSENLHFDEAKIKSLAIKTQKKSGDNVATAVFLAKLTPEMAKELRCYEAVYAKDGLVDTNFTGHTLRLKMAPVKVEMSPLAGKPFEGEFFKVQGFNIWPSEDGPEVTFTGQIHKRINPLVAFYNEQCESPIALRVISLQMDIDDIEDEQPATEAPAETVHKKPRAKKTVTVGKKTAKAKKTANGKRKAA